MTASPSPDPFWIRLISLGVRAEMPYNEKKSYYILNAGALIAMVAGGVYSALNLLQGRLDLLPFNLWFLLVGTAGRVLLRRGKLTAALVILVGSAANGLLMGYAFHNGVEDTIPLVIVTSFLVINRPLGRRLVAGLCCLGYFLLRAHQYHHYTDIKVPLGRYLVNVAIALGLLYLIMEVFRNVTDRYQKLLEERNRVVEQQWLMLDIERLTLLEKTRELEDANASKEELFSVVSHDLRGPIQNMKESLGFLHEGRLTPQEFMNMQALLKKEVDHFHESLETLLEWVSGQMISAKIQHEKVSLHLAVDQSIRLLTGMATAKEITLSNRVPEAATVSANGGQVHAIFRNLLGNAIKFTPRKGEITVKGALVGHFWQIEVRDNGMGMEPELASELFSLPGHYSTRGTDNEQGLGLGLQICRRFVGENGGRIWAESALGQGSTFYVQLRALVDAA